MISVDSGCHKLSENIWFVWSKRSYEWTKGGVWRLSTVGRNVKIRLEFWFLNSQWLPLSNKLTIWEWGLNLAWVLEPGRTFHPRDSGNPGSVAIWGAKDLEIQILAKLIYFFIVVVVLEKYMKGGIVCVTLPLMLQLRNDKRGEVCTVCTCCTLHSAKNICSGCHFVVLPQLVELSVLHCRVPWWSHKPLRYHAVSCCSNLRISCICSVGKYGALFHIEYFQV